MIQSKNVFKEFCRQLKEREKRQIIYKKKFSILNFIQK